MSAMGMGVDMSDDVLDFKELNWKSPGPVSTEFLLCKDDAPFIVGPVGSGKSTTADVVKCFIKAPMQIPGNDGIRRYRLIVFRKTQRQAWKSTIPTFKKWVSEDRGKFTGSEDRPCRFNFKISHPKDGGLIECEIWWYGMPETKEALEEALKGLEASDINLAEADQMPLWGFEWAAGRIGRHPSGPEGRCVNPQIFGTLNATTFENWVYDVFIANPKEGTRLFRQPPAVLYDEKSQTYSVNPEAENVEGHGGWENFVKYYMRQVKLSRRGYIKHALMAEFGPVDGEGFLVYPEFVDRDHVGVCKVNNNPLYIGLDGGGTPAATISQWGDYGEINVLREVVIFDPDDEKKQKLKAGVGPTQFAQAIKRVLAEFNGLEVRMGYIDPSAFYGGDSKYNDLAFAEKVMRELDIVIKAAPVDGNARVLREEGMRQYLSMRGDGGRPMILFDRSCRWLLQGLRGQFVYESMMKGGVEVPSDLRAVKKNLHSHVGEACEYNIAGMTSAGKASPKNNPSSTLNKFKPLPKSTYSSGAIQW